MTPLKIQTLGDKILNGEFYKFSIHDFIDSDFNNDLKLQLSATFPTLNDEEIESLITYVRRRIAASAKNT